MNEHEKNRIRSKMFDVVQMEQKMMTMMFMEIEPEVVHSFLDKMEAAILEIRTVLRGGAENKEHGSR